MKCKKYVYIFLLFICPLFIFGQLANFGLTVTKTDETCLGNGTLTFSTSGTTTGATITYFIYELPDETNPIAVQTTPFIGGRTSGTYKIVAVQTLGSETNSQTATITIDDLIVPLSYTISSTNSFCNDGTMTVNVTTGIGAQYEIISGPVIRPLQSTPTFTSLPSGVYQVRVFDNCGDATVITHTLSSGFSNITISPVSFPVLELPTCNSIMVSNFLTVGTNQSLNYPLQFNYTIFAPDGSSQSITSNLATGLQSNQEVSTQIPFYYDQIYTYDLTVTDNCGNSFTLNNNIVNQKLSASIIAQIAECGGYYLTCGAAIYRPDLFIQFLNAPPGFDPTAFNPNHPGPFNGPATDYGNYTNPVPFGTYEIQISDGCGRTATAEVTIVDEPSQPIHVAEPLPGCQSNISKVTISIPRFTVVTGIVTAAPGSYGIVPDDVTDQITGEGLVLENLITGNYTVVLTDECGNEYTYSFFVQDVMTTVSFAARPSCEIGKGSVRIRGNNTTLTSVIITNAPSQFGQSLPYNASFFIGIDGFSMDNLVPGSYSFKIIDNCGYENNVTLDVVGYAITANNFSITPYCGAFDITIGHFSNAILENFWLQKYDAATNSWVHPINGTVYVQGSVPNGLNSYPVQNNTTNLNLTFLGNFRIIKSFQTFENGNVGTFRTCIEVIQEFEFNDQIQFTGIEKVNCNGLNMDVKLFAIGVPPLNYSIIEKNGTPFIVNNGTNNVFTDLEPAIYTFKVDQSCGDSRNFISDVAQLSSLAIANQPNDMIACDDVSNDEKEIFNLTNQNAAVLGGQDASLFTITYHLSLEDATTNSNPLPNLYNSGNDEIFCRFKYTASDDCYDVVSFNVVVNPYFVNPPINITLCEDDTTTLIPDSGFISYQWSTGETSPSITVSEAGQYVLDIVQAFPNGSTCSGQYIYNVTTVSPPVIDYLQIVDWTDNENSIEVVLENPNSGNYEYSIDGITYQESPFFTNLNYGYYTVYVRDTSCGGDSANALVLNYPKYFTPNGDGYNDYWRINFSEYEPNMKITILDRFGKLITSFTSDSIGWDGTYNGRQLPSTDYWFVINREDGRILKGHFAMKR